jgi:hypothetical protein
MRREYTFLTCGDRADGDWFAEFAHEENIDRESAADISDYVPTVSFSTVRI